MTMVNKTDKILLLAKALKEANEAAENAAKGVDDGGTCNLDTVIIKLKRWRETDISMLAGESGIELSDKLSGWWNGYRFIRFRDWGMANRRTTAVEAAYKSLKESCKAIFDDDEYSVGVYYAMD